ncbi:SEC-C domain-containing protein [Paraburkholderia aromaticivorans]|uniref:SEC-C domain-containing protein n=1 Tax=Paraburkholderia aromaticivorans TaxID=2026199 RepID=UPI0038B7A556
MTIILSAGNHSYVMQFSDRRLSGGGKIIEEHSNKATVFVCGNGRFSVGFTGLAKIPGFAFQPWLVDALGRCAPPDYGIMQTAKRLLLELDLLFATHPGIRWLPSSYKRMTIMFSGYLYVENQPFIGNLWITNFQDFNALTDLDAAKPHFWVFAEREREKAPPPVTFIQRVGAWNAMTQEDTEILRRVLETSGSLDTIVDAGVSVVRRIANRPLSANTVGQEVAISIIPRDSRQQPTSIVRLSTGSDSITLLDSVCAFPSPDGSPALMMVRDLKLEVQNPIAGKPALNATQGPNERCWCKSGLKFKYCHGRAHLIVAPHPDDQLPSDSTG